MNRYAKLEQHIKDLKSEATQCVVECVGCKREADDYCTVYPSPKAQFYSGNCAMATHIKHTTKSKKVFVNPLKQSKRGGK